MALAAEHSRLVCFGRRAVRGAPGTEATGEEERASDHEHGANAKPRREVAPHQRSGDASQPPRRGEERERARCLAWLHGAGDHGFAAGKMPAVQRPTQKRITIIWAAVCTR